MSERLAEYLVALLGGRLSREAVVFIVSLMPILELRGGILAGFAMGMDFWSTFIISYIGNLLPIPFVLLFIGWFFDLLRGTRLSMIPEFFESRAIKRSESIKKYQYLGLLLFVGIPLPGTGAWTGALIASMLKMDKKKAFATIAVGVLMAGIIMSILSFGLLNAVFN